MFTRLVDCEMEAGKILCNIDMIDPDLCDLSAVCSVTIDSFNEMIEGLKKYVLTWMLLSLPIVISAPFLLMFTGTVGFTSSIRIWICSSSLTGSRSSSSSILSRLTNSPCTLNLQIDLASRVPLIALAC